MTSTPFDNRCMRALAGVALSLLLCACQKQVDFQAGLNDSEANDIVAALQDDGIAATKRTGKEGVTVFIRDGDLSRANALLNARGLPKRRQARLGEVFKKEGMISSPLEERARWIYALSQEIEFTLGQIDGVVLARVHVVLPEKPAPGEPVMPSSAAVFIKHRPELDPDLINARVRQLVARSIPGLGAAGIEKVSTVFVQASADPPKPVVEQVSPLTVALWWGAAGVLVAALAGVAYWQRHRLLGLVRRGPAAPEAA